MHFEADWTDWRDAIVDRECIATGKVNIVISTLIWSYHWISTWTRTLQRIYKFIKSEAQTTGWYQRMDVTTSRCQMLENQSSSLLHNFEVCKRKSSRPRINSDWFCFLHIMPIADTSPARGSNVATYAFKIKDWHYCQSQAQEYPNVHKRYGFFFLSPC